MYPLTLINMYMYDTCIYALWMYIHTHTHTCAHMNASNVPTSMQVKTMIFDKTGTLTHGKPVVTKVVLFASESVCPYQLFTALVGLAETNSEHPLGVAVVNFAQKVRTCS